MNEWRKISDVVWSMSWKISTRDREKRKTRKEGKRGEKQRQITK